MANAKKCDRCGALYELYDGVEFIPGGNKFDYIMLDHHWRMVHKTFDLCPECMTNLIKFLNGEENA